MSPSSSSSQTPKPPLLYLRFPSNPVDTSQQASSIMADPQTGTEVLTESARVNGTEADATLSGVELAWCPQGGGEGRRLELESEVLGCLVEGRKLNLAIFSSGCGDGERTSPLACGGGKGGGGAGDGRTRRRRGEVVLEMESDDAAAQWGDAVRDRLASLGN
jgi:sphingosine kinase